MSGAANAKKLKNEALRRVVEQVKCSLTDFQDFTRGLDVDLLEALLTDNPKTDAVATASMEIDEEFEAALVDFSGTVAMYVAKYDAQRKALDLG